MQAVASLSARERLLLAVQKDLVGPQGAPDERITAWPTDQYILGILYPLTEEGRDQDDEDKDAAQDAEGSPGEAISMSAMRRPNLMGISFAVQAAEPHIRIRGSAARYVPEFEEGKPERPVRWARVETVLEKELRIEEGLKAKKAVDGLQWWFRGVRTGDVWQITVALASVVEPAAPSRVEYEKACWFQVGYEVEAVAPSVLVPRRAPQRLSSDDDTEINELIYRDEKEWAVGHICSASWRGEGEGARVRSEWLPCQLVPSMSADGHAYFKEESTLRGGSPTSCFDADDLSTLTPQELERRLQAVPAAYERWQRDVERRIGELQGKGALTASQAARARKNLDTAAAITQRITSGIRLLGMGGDAIARRAFQLSQGAMAQQRKWARDDASARLVWRPFQLGFQLLVVESIARGEIADRRTMDLLWFPTGGGKTEAYLALTAFTLIHRRLSRSEPDLGAGVGVLMRYTLRLLTVQQFERASRLVLACEDLRRRSVAAGDTSLGTVPFSIGLWVGSRATPNTIEDARKDDDGRRRARQLARCPACNQKALEWDRDRKSPQFLVFCRNKGCRMASPELSLPIWTIDEEIYRVQPSLIIGTIDKFAQITRNPKTSSLFSGGAPPDLIIQDELHLISGPLGTVAGVYEAAVDLICRKDGVAPKVIGSTATIRRAKDQVWQLFHREVVQFPPPILDADDSCFAVRDTEAPGRLYGGISTCGRSPKFILQAVCASLMQAAWEPLLLDTERDPYWTLVVYFNSLRELGGALVMMQDDVNDSMGNYAQLHGEPRRQIEEPLELTSRVDQAEIPQLLLQLEQAYDPRRPRTAQQQTSAVVLATNMISVGVDVPRLGMMVINGQPKSMSEYIQASSRVGRDRVPGLVMTVYNAGRPRDRSHYEAFRTWHQTLYREVEATSVTPFAPRARDRALHAAIVALARHVLGDMREDPKLTPARRQRLESLVDELARRAADVDPEEEMGMREDARRFIDQWADRASLKAYWNEWKPDESLLVSAETVATAKAAKGRWERPAVGTPNSMRDVEPEVDFRMIPGLRIREAAAEQGEADNA